MKTHLHRCRYSRKITGAKLVIITALFTLLPFRAIHAQSWVYTWESTDGNPDGFSATIVLDSPENANGSGSDTLSVSFSDNYTSMGNSDVSSLLVVSPFSWNPQTITQGYLRFSAYPSRDLAFGFGPNWLSQYGASGVYYQDTGYWSGSAVSVPEPSTWGLLGGVTAVVSFLHRRRKAGSVQLRRHQPGVQQPMN